MSQSTTLDDLRAQLESQNTTLETALAELRACPQDIVLALPKETLGDLHDACTPRVISQINPLAMRA